MKSLMRNLKSSVGGCVAVTLLASTLMVTTIGCTPAQTATAQTAAAKIAYEIPKVQPLITTACSIAASVDPAIAPAAAAVCTTVQASLVVLDNAVTAYSANPSATAWQSVQAAVNALLNNNATALLDAAHIVDPAVRSTVQIAIGAVQTVLLIIDSYTQSTQTVTAKVTTASLRTYKLRDVAPYLDKGQIEEATGYSFDQAMSYETALGF